MRILGFLIGALGTYFVILVSADFLINHTTIFLDFYGFFGLLAVVIGITIGTRNFKTLIAGINGALSEKYAMTAEQRDKSVSFFKLLRTTVLYYSVLLVFMSLTLLLLDLDDPSTFGPKVAIALQSLTWGAGINMLILNPAIYMLQQKQALEESPSAFPVLDVRSKGNQTSFRSSALIKDKDAAEKLLQLCFEKGITHEEIMEADDITLRRKM